MIALLVLLVLSRLRGPRRTIAHRTVVPNAWIGGPPENPHLITPER